MRGGDTMTDKEGNEIITTEAPVSVTTTAYYKGFSMMITKRDPEVDGSKLLEQQIKLIDWLVAHNFKPSWNDETNKKALGEDKSSEAEEEFYPEVEDDEIRPDYCPVHKTMMNKREGQFGTFYSHYHAAFGYCNGKGYKKRG